MIKYFQALLLIALGFSGPANAALIDRGGGLIYDDDLNITWLADANYAQTSGNDLDGLKTWSQAMTWASNLSYGGYTDWRLPIGGNCVGYNCTGSEMGHLFYNELGGVAGQSITTTHNTNYNLFQNVQSLYGYWSSTEWQQDPLYALFFGFSNGGQNVDIKSSSHYMWAVRPGDVAAVPVPAAVWLFGSGLLGLVGIARSKRKEPA